MNSGYYEITMFLARAHPPGKKPVFVPRGNKMGCFADAKPDFPGLYGTYPATLLCMVCQNNAHTKKVKAHVKCNRKLSMQAAGCGCHVCKEQEQTQNSQRKGRKER
jgi:hypothetical protein